MDERVAKLEQRVAELERQLAELRQALQTRTALPRTPGPYDHYVPILRRALEAPRPSPEELAALRRQLGIEGVEPIGAEQLQALQIAEGADPNGNEASRELIEMREE